MTWRDSTAPYIATAAITGGMTIPGQSAAIPVTTDAIVDSAVAAHAAGAAIVHIHVRDPSSGRPVADVDLFGKVMSEIAAACDAIVQPTTGGGVGMTIDERARVISEYRPEMASFNTGSFNFGIFGVTHRPEMASWEIDYLESTRDYVFRNSFADLYRLAEIFAAAGTKPEFECYDVGHLYNLSHLLDRGLVQKPLHIGFVLGVLGANAATVEQLVHMLRTAETLFGPDGFTWSTAGIGYPGQFHLASAALMLGGHARVGLEDNLRLNRDRRASSNAELVAKLMALGELLDRRPVSSDEARRILGIPRGIASTNGDASPVILPEAAAPTLPQSSR
jgi:uncharacterized protein (DUF849 family)